ncbi:MAG: Type 1 glutamine amidotransferase-like domain-containing protein [Holophagales bacterium]|nr:Type 1 glutamine amidotransferase-like domain-containing protein [Holophagales bacterium]
MTRFRLLLSLALLAALPIPTIALGGDAQAKGHLVLIGGGEKPPEVMRKFVELAGGKDAPIVMIPTASSEPDAASYYEKLFREEHGCTNAVSLDIRKKADAQRADWTDLARKARGIFFGGGDQIRITSALLGTPVGDAIARRIRGRSRRRRDLRRHRLPERADDHRRGKLLPGRHAQRRALDRASGSSPATSSSTSTSSGASARTASSP